MAVLEALGSSWRTTALVGLSGIVAASWVQSYGRWPKASSTAAFGL